MGASDEVEIGKWEDGECRILVECGTQQLHSRSHGTNPSSPWE